MEQNKGYIAVASVPGEGTSFSLYLPLSPEDAVSETIDAQPVGLTAPEAGMTVLVVEDEPAVRAIAVRSLERGGFRVLQAPDAAVALQLADREARLDLVLTDLMMPGIGGGRACTAPERALAGSPRDAHVGVLRRGAPASRQPP
ncbi:MAG: response regulator [Gemmatimonadales bacterium]|nr:response regulator [Gemmatimonadales bacterium]